MSKKTMTLGGGGRFQKLEGELAGRKGVTNPGALAASIGRKKYGNTKFNAMEAKGRKRSNSSALADRLRSS